MSRQLQRVVFIACLLASFAGAAQESIAQSQAKANALLTLPDGDYSRLQQVLSAVKSSGGRVDHVFPPNGAIVLLPAERDGALQASFPLLRIHRGPVEITPSEQAATGADIAGQIWQMNYQMPQPAPAFGREGRPVPRHPPNDARVAPDRASQAQRGAALGPRAAAPPGTQETSEYFIGSVVVSIITPESNGAIDINRETWSSTRQNTVVTKIQQGLQWWKDNANAPANLTFVYDIHHSAPTSYEPISRSSNDEGLWIAEVIAGLGTPNSGDYFAQVRSYINGRRQQFGTDWAMAIFVVDSRVDGDGEFTNGDFAYTYLNGPFMVMTYDNDGWGIDHMDNVTAHENGHMWGALDEYASLPCDPAEVSGYLGVANSNCENGNPTEHSIMRSAGDQTDFAFPQHLVSTPARYMVGWRDSDGDGKERYDPVDTTPTISLTAFSPNPTTDSTPTYSGSAQDVATPSANGPGVSINKIVAVEWRVDGGPWQSAIPNDGGFNSYQENFTFTPPVLSTTSHTFEARATNTVGNVSTIASDLLVVNPDPNLPTVTVTAFAPTATESDLTNGYITVTRTGSTASTLVVDYSVGGTALAGQDYRILSGITAIPAGASATTLGIVPIDDLAVEPTESVVVQLKLSSLYNIGAPSTASVDLLDNDPSQVVTVNCVTDSLQTAIANAMPGTVLFVVGTCNENILVANDKQRITIDGGNNAMIRAPSSTAPAFNVRGKGILILGFDISGGSHGIHVNRGSNATIRSNIIHEVAGHGVMVNQLSFASITNNTIQNSLGAGIWVGESSTARVGFSSDTETVSSGNFIQNNTVGIVVSHQSSTRIVGNTINSNNGDGILVLRDAQADIAGNSISGNAGSGIAIGENSMVQLGEDGGTSIFEIPNFSGSSNAAFGIECASGAMADGRLGSLNGSSGQVSFTADCINSLL